ncbi:hypothetical protein N665_0598s0010, partial [Sinapis alba]
ISKINNLEYAALNLSGDNYLQWVLDTKIILKSKEFGECITEDNNASEKDKYMVILIIRHHLAESLKDQYLTIENPLDLWTELKSRYDHQRTVILPKAMYDLRSLRIRDYKSVDEYNSALFKIVSKLKLCDLFHLSHTSNVLLQQQYREKGFQTYANIISCILLDEQNNELLMRNSELRSPGSTPLPEAHAATEAKKETNHVQDNGQRGRGRGRWHGRGRGHYHPYGRGQGNSDGQGNHYGSNRGYQSNYGRGRGRGCGMPFKPQDSTKSVCYRCGMSNH